MPVTPGSSKRLNKLSGVSSMFTLTATQEADATLMARVLESGILVRFSDKTAAIGDNVSTLAELKANPQIDQRLLTREKNALMLTFSGENGAYAPTEGGFLVLSENGRMDSNQLPVDVWNTETGKILLSALPDTVRAGIQFVANYAALQAIQSTDEATRGFVFVADASGDPSVTRGAAVYCYVDDPDNVGSKKWLKWAEMESIDLDLDQLGVSTATVEAAGAVMYNHTVQLEAPSIEDYFALVDYVPTYSLTPRVIPNPSDHSKPQSVQLTVNEYDGSGEGLVLTVGSDTYTVGAGGTVTASAGATGSVTYAGGVFVFTPTAPVAAQYSFSVSVPNAADPESPTVVSANNVAFAVA